MERRPNLKPVVWVGPSLGDLKAFPRQVQRDLGAALQEEQRGGMPLAAKPLKGFKGASVRELRADYDGDTYRSIYTVRFAPRIYVLHSFQKKAKKGIKTPKHVIDLIKARLKEAQRIQAELETDA